MPYSRSHSVASQTRDYEYYDGCRNCVDLGSLSKVTMATTDIDKDALSPVIWCSTGKQLMLYDA